jgi:hypothetical protein
MLSLVVAVGFLVAIPAGPASAATTVLNATDTGWWSDTGEHGAFNSNYIVGNYGYDYGDHNDYFTFDLTTAVPCGAITGATLSAPNPLGSGSPRPYTLYDVSTPAAALDTTDTGSPAGIAIFNDLGSGTVFGSVTPTTVNDTPIVVPFSPAGVAALNAARGGTFSVGGDLTDAVLNDFLLGNSGDDTVSLTLTTEDPFQPDAQIRGGLASAYLGGGIYNQDGLGQTFGRKAKPGFGDQFNVKIENDGGCSDTFLVQGAGNYNKFKVTYWSGPLNVTPSVVSGTFQTGPLDPGSSELLRVFIYTVRGVRIGTSMTDLISVTSNGDPSVSDVVGATLRVSKTAGDFNSQLPVP